MLAAGLSMAQVFKDSHIRALEENMAREINLLESTFSFIPVDDPGAVSYYTAKAQELDQLIDSRITFINLDGTVIGDSEMLPGEMDNHKNARRSSRRPATRSAARSGIARRSAKTCSMSPGM